MTLFCDKKRMKQEVMVKKNWRRTNISNVNISLYFICKL